MVHPLGFFQGAAAFVKDAGRSPQKRGECPQTGAKPGAAVRPCLTGGAERMGRDSSGRKRGMGRRSSEEEKRDSSLRGPARKQRAQEKTGPLRSE